MYSIYFLLNAFYNQTNYLEIIKAITFSSPTVPYLLHILTRYTSLKSLLSEWTKRNNVINDWKYHMICILSESLRY